MTQYALVLDTNRKPLAPCHPARARELLRKGKAAVFRKQPFTIILNHTPEGPIKNDLQLKIDPGSKTTGLAVVVPGKKNLKCVLGINLIHRGATISSKLEKRAAQRRSRRQRKTRYRAPRFLNRTRPKGWLPPSVLHRALTTQTWIDRLLRWSTISSAAIELVKFDTQKLRNPEIGGKDYQQGRLFQTEMREYLLYTYGHTCQYCLGTSKDPILQREHLVPKSRGGSDALYNATLSCKTCNRRKAALTPREWLNTIKGLKGKYYSVIQKQIPLIVSRQQPTLKDAAVVNAIRYRLIDYTTALGLNPEVSPGWVTKRNRIDQGYRKGYWIDAACVGTQGSRVYISPKMLCLTVTGKGHGSRQMVTTNKYGFPIAVPKGPSKVKGLSTGDLVEARVPRGKYEGYYRGRCVVRTNRSVIVNGADFSSKYTKLLQKADGFDYGVGEWKNLTVILDKGERFDSSMIKSKHSVLNIRDTASSRVVTVKLRI